MKLNVHKDDTEGPRIKKIEASHVGDLIYLGEAVNLSPWTAESYLDELNNPNAIMLRLVSDDNKTIGFIVGRFVCSGGESGDAEIYNLAVKQTEQRKGNGQLLFNAFLEKCLGRVSNIWLEVRESNKDAIAFYERNGFILAQRRSHFYDNPREHALLMRLALEKCQA